MTKEITIQNNSLEMLNTLRNTVAPGLTEPEFQLFAEMCRATGLNPALKEIWAIKAGGRLQLMTGINGFLKIANSHPQFDGMEVEHQFDGGKLMACTVKVHRKDRKFPAVATAFMAEYAKPTPIWKQMPSVMLAKCAKSLAIREAFIQELGGFYTAEEMPAEFAVPKEPKEQNIHDHFFISEKTGKVIGTKTAKPAKAPTIDEVVITDADLGYTNTPLKESVTEAANSLKIDSGRLVTTYYDLTGLIGDTKTAAELYLVGNRATRVGDSDKWVSKFRLEKLTSCIVEGVDVQED